MTTGTEASQFRLFLQEELVRRCKKNPSYSIRAFARFLETDHSSLAKILNGKLTAGPHTVTKFGSKLGFTPTDFKKFIAAPNKPTKSKTSGITLNYEQLTLDSFKVISDWYHYAILELMRVKGFRSDLSWVARALGISLAEARSAFERLVRLNMISQNKRGKWVDHTNGTSTTIGNPFTASAFRNLQRQILERALIALEDTPLSRRDQSSMTMAIDSRKLGAAKQRIKDFRRELDQFLGQGELDEVYHLSVSLYPVTQFNAQTQEKQS